MSDYSAIRAVNWSSLKHMATSPLLYKWRTEHPEPPKQAFVLGGAIHTAILEPEKFEARYAVWEGKVRRGKAWDAWQEDNVGKESLTPSDVATVEACVAAVQSHRVARDLFTGGRREETTEWVDPRTGMKCKGRLDYTRPDFIVDLKTTRDPRKRKFSRDAAEYMYHGQLAFYQDGAIAAGKIPPDAPAPWVVALQTSEPFDVACYQLSWVDLEAGRVLYRELIERLRQCIEANYWPGVAPEAETLDLPTWAPGMNGPEAVEEIF